MFARPLIDSVEFAKQGKELRGEIKVSELSRLADMLTGFDDVLDYSLRGFQAGDKNMLELTLRGRFQLRCQRCLADFPHPLEVAVRYCLLPTEKLDEVEEDEEFEVIEANPRLDVLELIEEELLLGLPYAPKHAEGECVMPAAGRQQSVSPFAVLAGLKK